MFDFDFLLNLNYNTVILLGRHECSALRRLVFQVKNKAPAEVQITAEQLLREAKERELELLPPPPKQKITDEEELNDYKLRKRKVMGCLLVFATAHP